MEKKDPLELDHEYDGIKELDHPLPRWWLLTFYGAIVFSIGYFIYYNFMNGPTLKQVFNHDLQKIQAKREVYLEKLAEMKTDKFYKIYDDPQMSEYGREIYNFNCMGCHNSQGLGDIGPNLGDKYWLYSDGTPELVLQFIIGGNPTGGMPSWGDKLDEDELYSVVAYLMKLKNPENSGKAPQGEAFERWQKE